MTDEGAVAAPAFRVRLEQFEGPFDLLLQLISKHRLDVTEVALSRVSDDFLAHVRAAGDRMDLEEATGFLVVAATLLDLKAARLLPQGEVEDEEDVARLEARDLLFVRLLQYRAFRQAAALLAELVRSAARRHPRTVPLEPRWAAALPDVVLPPAQRLAELAAGALRPRPVPQVSVEHVHAPTVDVAGEADLLRDRLRAAGGATFRDLVAGASTMEVVARFLALLDLFREGVVAFEQPAALAELTVHWEQEAA